MRRTAAATVVTGLVLLTACGTQQADPPTAAAAASSSPGSVCATATLPKLGDLYDATDVVRVPDGFVATGVVECVVERRPVPGDGVWNFLVEKRATAGIDALVTAIRRPDEPTPTPVGCNDVGYSLPWFALVDESGRVARATVPADSCGQPQAAGRAALGALPFVEVSATRRDQVQTEAEMATDAAASAVGCTSLFKDMVAVTDGWDHAALRSAPDPILASSSGVVTVCRYSAGKDGDGTPLLSFLSGEKLSAAATAALQHELAASGNATTCTEKHTAVTGLFTVQNGWALVEVDGCRRVESGDSGGWRQATPELIALLG